MQTLVELAGKTSAGNKRSYGLGPRCVRQCSVGSVPINIHQLQLGGKVLELDGCDGKHKERSTTVNTKLNSRGTCL